MDEQNISSSRRTRFLDDNKRMFENSSYISYERHVKVRGTSTDPVIHVLHDSSPNFRNFTRASKNLEIPANLAILNEEFNDLTRKMALLKEALRSTGNEKKLGPVLINSSSQALQVTNLQDVNAAKRFIHDCIIELTFVDDFLTGKEGTSANLREKLQEILTRECVGGKNVVIQGSSMAPNTFELISPGYVVANLAVGTSDDFFKQHRKEVEIQTDSIVIKVSESSNNKNHIGESHSVKVFLEPVDKENVNSNQLNQRKKKKWYSICGECTGKKKCKKETELTAGEPSSLKLQGKSPKKSPIHLTI